MPQMSPLMWMELFAAFSLMLMISMVKIYFTPGNTYELKEVAQGMGEMCMKIKWTW